MTIGNPCADKLGRNGFECIGRRSLVFRETCVRATFMHSDIENYSTGVYYASLCNEGWSSVLARIEKFSNLPVINFFFTVIKTKDQLFLRGIWADKMRKKAHKLAVYVFRY